MPFCRLQDQGVASELIDCVRAIYANEEGELKVNDWCLPFEIHRGVRQGDTLSPKLFTAAVECAFRNLEWTDRGIKVDGNFLSHLRFADDIVLIAHTRAEVQRFLSEMNTEIKKIGLEVNFKKTHAMTNRTELPISVEGQAIGYKSEFVYLGHLLSVGMDESRELRRRVQAGWAVYHQYSDYFRARYIPRAAKAKLFNGCVLPAMTYAAETWITTKRDRARLAAAQHRMERRALGITLRDRRSNTWVRERTLFKDINIEAAKKKWRWAEKLSRMSGDRWARRLLEWQPRKWKRPVGRPKSRWRDEFTAALGLQWLRNASENSAIWTDAKAQRVEELQREGQKDQPEEVGQQDQPE